MQETRRKLIEWRIVTNEDIRRFAAIFANESRLAEKAGSNFECTYQIVCSDQTTYESSEDDIFDDNNLLDLKKVMALKFSFWRHMESGSRRLDLSLQRGGGYSDGLSISGPDRGWVSATFDNMSAISDAMTVQTAWPLRHPTLTFWLIALAVGSCYSALIHPLIHHFSDSLPGPPSSFEQSMRNLASAHFLSFWLALNFLIWVVRIFVGLPVAAPIRSWMFKLWPQIEFDFGPTHTRPEKARRAAIFALWGGVVASILAAFLIDL
ncbi:MAG: hypothetical protein ABSB74_03830 [Tepidisphaeraceae bacterium]